MIEELSPRCLEQESVKENKSVSYRLSQDIESAIKSLAVKIRKEVSQLVREILQKYINEQKRERLK